MAKFKRMFLLATPLLGVCSGFALAADLPKEGYYDHTTCFTRNSTRIDYAKTHFAYSYEETGQSVSNPPVACSTTKWCIAWVCPYRWTESARAVLCAKPQRKMATPG